MGLYKPKKNGKPIKKWWMCFTVDGVEYRRSTGTNDHRLAEKILKKIETQIVEGKWFDLDTARLHNLDELMERYLNEHSKPNKAKSTYDKDRAMKETLRINFAKVMDPDITEEELEDFSLSLEKITPELILSYKNKRIEQGAAQNTILNELGMLRNSLNIATGIWHWIRHNPFSDLKLGLKANFIDRWLTDEEEQLLLEKAEGKVFGQLPDIILLDLHTGLSQEELLNLKLTQIDFARRTLTTTRKKTKKKDKPTRTIPLNSVACSILMRRAKLNSGSKYVFCNSVGNRIDAGRLKREFIKAVKESGIEHFRFHDLRHTFATRLVQKGVDLYKVAKLLGHSSITVTERYAHHCPESLRTGVEILEDLETAILEKPVSHHRQYEGDAKEYHTFITPAVKKDVGGIYYSLN